MAISYEYEPCDLMKSLSEYTAMMGLLYEKSANEDILSIMIGISQQKGNIHLSICQPIQPDEIAHCASLVKNERFSALAEIIDRRIHKNYKLHKTNYVAADLLSDSAKYVDYYSTDDMEHFIAYSEHSMLKGPSTAARDKVTDIFLQLYANPVLNQYAND